MKRGSHVERGCAVPPCEVHVSIGSYEGLNNLGVAVLGCYCYGRYSIIPAFIRFRLCVDQLAKNYCMTVLRCRKERCGTMIALSVTIRAMMQQQCHNLAVAILGGNKDRRYLVPTAQIWVGVSLE